MATTTLRYYCQQGDIENVRSIMFSQHCDPMYINISFCTAVANDHVHVAKFLVDFSITCVDFDCYRPIGYALDSGNSEMLQLLLNFLPYDLSWNNNRLLMLCLKFKKIDIVRMLLKDSKVICHPSYTPQIEKWTNCIFEGIERRYQTILCLRNCGIYCGLILRIIIPFISNCDNDDDADLKAIQKTIRYRKPQT